MEEDIADLYSPNGCECNHLYRKIDDQGKDLAKKYLELSKNKKDFPPTGPESYSLAGHIQQLHDKQDSLRLLLIDFNTKECKQELNEAWKYASIESDVDLEKVFEMNHVTAQQAENLAMAVGVSLTALAVVFAAPELVTIGLLAELVALYNTK